MGLVITKIKEHRDIKKMILEEINNTQQNSFEKITSTDWMTPSNIERTYFTKYIKKIIDKYYVQIAKKLKLYNFNIAKLIIHNWWFQIYNKHSSHDWHTHRSCHFTNVYFLELQKNHLVTQIKGHKKLNIKEGDLITFPAYWLHRSPINDTNKRKIIISFNTSYDY
jgi:hypothetical protein